MSWEMIIFLLVCGMLGSGNGDVLSRAKELQAEGRWGEVRALFCFVCFSLFLHHL